MTFHDDNDDVHGDGAFVAPPAPCAILAASFLVPTFEQGLRLQIALGLESL